MMRARRRFVFVALGGAVFFWGAAATTFAQVLCCRCQTANPTRSICVREISDLPTGSDCAALTTRSDAYHRVSAPRPAFEGFNCVPTPLTAAQCRTVAEGGVCGGSDFYAQAIASVPELWTALQSRSIEDIRKIGGVTGPTTATAPRPFASVTPELGVSIPGLTFSPATQEAGTVNVPFLAQYIAAAYRYAVRIVVIVAMVMVVYGGFRYLTGSAFEQIQRGKEIIVDAVIGMLLVLGAFTILQTINPATLSLNPLELTSVERVNLDQIWEQSPDVDTSEASRELSSTETPPGCVRGARSGAPPAFTRTRGPAPSFTTCPVTLTSPATLPPARASQPADLARRDEFRERIVSVATGANIRERILKVADAAANCQVTMGNCGRTAQTISALGGLTGGRGSVLRNIGSERVRYLIELNHQCDPPSGQKRDRGCVYRSMQAAFQKFQSEIPGYPDDWAQILRPGDYIVVYNGNSSAGGQHAAIFMGWAANGRARLVHGGWGTLIWDGTLCLTSHCSCPTPLTHIYPVD